jgi:hypothetical protein
VNSQVSHFTFAVVKLGCFNQFGLVLVAIRNTGVSLWIEALDRHPQERLEAVNAPSEVAEAMINRLNRAMDDLTTIAEYFED